MGYGVEAAADADELRQAAAQSGYTIAQHMHTSSASSTAGGGRTRPATGQGGRGARCGAAGAPTGSVCEFKAPNLT